MQRRTQQAISTKQKVSLDYSNSWSDTQWWAL